MGMSVRPLRREDIGVAAPVLAAAFDEDPLFRWLLPERARRAAWLRWFHAHALGESVGAEGAYTLEDGANLGAIASFAPGRWPPPLLRSLAAIEIPPGLPTWRLVRAGIHVESRIRALHPEGPHVYVYVLGVHPDQKGRGLGGALLRHAIAQAREAGACLHLETSNPVNLPFYRRFGLDVKEEIVSHGGPPVWTMTTSPHAGAPPSRANATT
jgi:ribosomal protein S18 acetylase RimI-like enzyme